MVIEEAMRKLLIKAYSSSGIKQSARTLKADDSGEIREPLTDLFEEDNTIRIFAELPGEEKGDIKLDLKDDILEITAHTGDRKYCKEVLLPIKAKPENMTFAYRNGILEVKIRKT